jgi:hypothetical protein
LRFEGQRLGEGLPDRIGHGLPDRSLAHRTQVIQRVVEQPVGEVFEGLPVGGIEGIFRSGFEPAQRHDRSLELRALRAP